MNSPPCSLTWPPAREPAQRPHPPAQPVGRLEQAHIVAAMAQRPGRAQSREAAADDKHGGRPARCGGDSTFGGECCGCGRSGSVEQLPPGEGGHQGQCTTPLNVHKEPSFEGWSEGARWATLSEAAEVVVRRSPLAYLMDFMSDTEDTTRRTTSGQTLPLVVVFLLTLLLFCGAVIDIGNAYRVKQALQASADAAVAAGAGNLPNTGAASAAAHNLSAENTAKNRIAGVPNVTANITMDCSTSPNFCSPANTVHITETANIPTYFLRLIGISTITESVHAQACSPCGGLPLDVDDRARPHGLDVGDRS